MATYSLLFIDANEHIGRSRQIESPTDQQAVDRAAKEPGNYRAVQVWDGDRPVALIGNPRCPEEDFAHPFRSQWSAPDTEVNGATTCQTDQKSGCCTAHGGWSGLPEDKVLPRSGQCSLLDI
jgi:hypothetical protein